MRVIIKWDDGTEEESGESAESSDSRFMSRKDKHSWSWFMLVFTRDNEVWLRLGLRFYVFKFKRKGRRDQKPQQ